MRPSVVVAVALSFTFILGCTLLEKKRAGDNDAPPANTPTVTVSGSGAKNEKDVLRYASETKVANEAATVGKDFTKAKTFPASGAEVATLSKGTTVVELAKFFSTGVLVLFDDPTTRDGTKLMGWVTPESLTALSGPPPTPTLPQAFTAARLTTVDAGGPKAVDAGRPAVPDAGVAPVVPTAPVAPNAPAGPAQLLQVLPTGGTCPAPFVLIGPFCRRPCTADSNCPPGAFCTNGAGGRKTCSATK